MTTLIVFCLLSTSWAQAKVLPGDSASYKGILFGNTYSLYRVDVIAFDEKTWMTEYKLTEVFEDGTRKESVEKKQVMTDFEGKKLEEDCAEYGENRPFSLPTQPDVATCRIRDMNDPELFIDVAEVPFGYVYFHDPDGSYLEMTEFIKN